MNRREPIHLYNSDGEPITLDVHYECNYGGHTLLVVTDRADQEFLPFVLYEKPVGRGEYEYTLIDDQEITQDVFDEYRASLGEGDEEEDVEEDEDNFPFPPILYPADEILYDIPFDDEFDLTGADGSDSHFELRGGLLHNGKRYLLVYTDFDDPNIPRGTPLAFLLSNHDENLSIVKNDDLTEKLFEAYGAEEERALDEDDDFDDDDFGSKSSGSFEKTVPLQGKNGKRYPFNKIAGVDVGPNFYLILSPQFHIDGFDADDALVFQVKGEGEERYLQIILDEDINDKVFAEYNKIFDAKHRVGARSDDDDDLFM